MKRVKLSIHSVLPSGDRRLMLNVFATLDEAGDILPRQEVNVDVGRKTVNTLGEGTPPSGHFMAYFVTLVVIVVAGYLIFHNKQRVNITIVVLVQLCRTNGTKSLCVLQGWGEY